MGGHDHHHAEDTTVPLKVGIFLVCTFLIIAWVATL